MTTQQVNDKPAERSLGITNILLSMLILLGGVASAMITFSLNNVNNSVVAVESSVNKLNVSTGVMDAKVSHLIEDVNEVKGRVTKLEDKWNDYEK